MKFTISLKKSVEENAGVYFEKAKKARKKLEGAKAALDMFQDELKVAEKTAEKEIAEQEEHKKLQKEKAERKLKQEWYEKFRWFISSEGFLVIGGRDATTNEIIIKKQTLKDDVVFHTDMSGSPFFVIKTEGKKVGEATLQETSDATFCYSRAWKLGLITSDVFHVKPDQVSKEANPGEYLSKGAFMIRGKTTYLLPNAKCAVGMLKDGRIMGGPLEAVRTHCEKFVEIQQGKGKPSDAAKMIKKLIGGELDDIIRALPPGAVQVKKK